MHDNARCIELIGDFDSTKPCDLRGPQPTTLVPTLPSTSDQPHSISGHFYAVMRSFTDSHPFSSSISRSGARGLQRGAASGTDPKTWRRGLWLAGPPVRPSYATGAGVSTPSIHLDIIICIAWLIGISPLHRTLTFIRYLSLSFGAFAYGIPYY